MGKIARPAPALTAICCAKMLLLRKFALSFKGKRSDNIARGYTPDHQYSSQSGAGLNLPDGELVGFALDSFGYHKF